jgi:hypothetical protein
VASILTVTSAATVANRRLCTLAAVKAELNIAVTTHDTDLTSLIDSASGVIADHCKRTLAQETVRETWRDVTAMEPLILTRWPVSAIVGVTVDGAAIDADDYEVDGERGFLWRLVDDARRCWTATKLVVEYTAGWRVPDQADATLPEGISRAAVVAVAAWHKGKGRDPMLRSNAADGIGSSSWIATADMGALPPQSQSLLSKYVARSA